MRKDVFPDLLNEVRRKVLLTITHLKLEMIWIKSNGGTGSLVQMPGHILLVIDFQFDDCSW